MKVLITEGKFENLVIRYLDENYPPDYGWYENDRTGTYQDDVDKWGDITFYINDVDSYMYYGCNAGEGDDMMFDPYGYLHNYECPLLLIYPRIGRKLTELFGSKWKPIFKEWFESNTGLEVKQITDDYI
jgi:hypothetical protein